MHILIKNGQIIDGTGSQPYIADLYILDGKIAEIGTGIHADEEGCTVIDAANRVVAPGFIDMHNHADLTILDVNKAEAYLMQGVTTMLVSVCGIGLAPANERVEDFYLYFIGRLFGTEEIRVHGSLADYFKEIEILGCSANLAFLIPHGNVRCSVMGVEERPATDAELEEMKALVHQEMVAGAFGLSTGLMYPPGSAATTAELVALSKVVGKYNGIYNSHMRNEGAGVLTVGMEELISIAREAKIRAHISHWKAAGLSGSRLIPKMISLVRRTHDEGLEISADVYPYDEGATSLSAILLRPWVFEDFYENLSNAETRKRIIAEIFDLMYTELLANMPWFLKILPKKLIQKLIVVFVKRKARIISVLHNKHIEGKYIGKALADLYPQKTFMEALLDFIRDEEGAVMASFKLSSERIIFQLLKQDFVAIGSDGFLVKAGNTHPRSYGTFPKILGNYVRNKKIFSLVEAIRKMTGLPAQILGLKDRGILKKGNFADIVIFDPTTIQDKATYENGRQFPQGIEYVIVNGSITVDKGLHTGALKGKTLRHQMK